VGFSLAAAIGVNRILASLYWEGQIAAFTQAFKHINLQKESYFFWKGKTKAF